MREVTSLQESAFCNLISVPCSTKSSKKKCSINALRLNELTDAWISQLHNNVSRHSEPSHCKGWLSNSLYQVLSEKARLINIIS